MVRVDDIRQPAPVAGGLPHLPVLVHDAHVVDDGVLDQGEEDEDDTRPDPNIYGLGIADRGQIGVDSCNCISFSALTSSLGDPFEYSPWEVEIIVSRVIMARGTLAAVDFQSIQ